MKKSFPNQLTEACWRPSGAGAFTLTDLLVVMGSVVMLAVVLLSVSFTTQERVLRAQCTDNLRQIGVGWNIYQQEFNQVMPCYWPGVTTNVGGTTANPWETYLAYRVNLGTVVIGGYGIQGGPWNLAGLFANKLVPSPKIFYCPSLARIASSFSYDYYAAVSNSWPSVSGSSGGNGDVRAGYNYYPQLRATQYAGMGQYVPKAAVTPTKWTALDTRKSIVTDLVDSTDTLSHQDSGFVAGLNALFPDGRVVFQNARNDPRTGFNSPWFSLYWQSSGPGYNPNYFRIIMNDWNP